MGPQWHCIKLLQTIMCCSCCRSACACACLRQVANCVSNSYAEMLTTCACFCCPPGL
jgi:hypothetical protein